MTTFANEESEYELHDSQQLDPYPGHFGLEHDLPAAGLLVEDRALPGSRGRQACFRERPKTEARCDPRQRPE
jgi:hypothetical protein